MRPARLKARAAAHHRSLEEEARELLRAAVSRQDASTRENLGALARRLFGPEHGAGLDIPPRGSAPGSIPPDFRVREIGPAVILLDTNGISELVRTEPHPEILAYVSGLAPETVFTAAVREAEIHRDLARMPAGRKRDDLIARIAELG